MSLEHPVVLESKEVHIHATERMEICKGMQESTKRAPYGQSRNNLSSKISKVVLNYHLKYEVSKYL